jgi:alkanesulfonate monooxygenase SsuD/methylene tetrahydromethanopterin reductase-like flavin-dependent oxidoreductase (luciferase family)
MKFGVVYPGSAPLEALQLGIAAEEAGWDAFFVWEAVRSTDPWVVLGAIAARTSRIRLGTMLTPVPVRRPWKLAAETATLDALSGGRAILSAALGAADTGFTNFGLPTDRKLRAALLDESLDILEGLWSGKPFAYKGEHYRIKKQTFAPPPPPIQRRGSVPHVPVWLVGAWGWEKSMNRVLRCDGLIPTVLDEKKQHRPAAVDELAAMRAWLDANAPAGRRIDLIVDGATSGDNRAAQAERLAPLAEAGVDWWVENFWAPGAAKSPKERIEQGPPTF